MYLTNPNGNALIHSINEIFDVQTTMNYRHKTGVIYKIKWIKLLISCNINKDC